MRLLKFSWASGSNLQALGGGEPRRKGMREKEMAQEKKSAQEKSIRGMKVRADRLRRRVHLAFSVVLITCISPMAYPTI